MAWIGYGVWPPAPLCGYLAFLRKPGIVPEDVRSCYNINKEKYSWELVVVGNAAVEKSTRGR